MLSLTEMAGKAVGAAKAASAAISGYRGIFRTLKREHGEVSVLLMRIATEKNGHIRARVMPLLVRELLAHGQAEDAEFYSVLSDHESTRILATRLRTEHERMDALIAELADLSPGSATWIERFRELQQAVQEHIELEERQVFPRAKRVLSLEATEEIDHRYRLEKVRLLGSTSPPSDEPPGAGTESRPSA